MNSEKMLEEFSKEFGFGYINSDISNNLEIKKEIVNIISPQIAQKYHILPWQIDSSDDGEKVLTILTSNMEALRYQQEIIDLARESLKETNEYIDKIDIFNVAEKHLENAINAFYHLEPSNNYDEGNIVVIEGINDDDDLDDTVDKEDLQNSNSPVVKLVDTIIHTAVKKKASDIHLEPIDSGMIVKFRIDGSLVPQNTFFINEKNKKNVVARIKILSGLELSKRKESQDGSVTLNINSVKIDFRVSVLPTIHGEKTVLRILDKTTSLLELEKLGFDDEDIKEFIRVINKPTGMVLITGPTGSGKSTTLYSFLNRLDSVSKNITTVENPVEYQLKGINQVSVDDRGNKKGMDSAGALRSILRQDPDTIMIGEIRDKETAENAVQASQTGHLVFATVHTNDALSVISRLKRFDIEPDEITQSLMCVMAQRLVRKICPHCKTEYTPDFKKLGTLDEDIVKLKRNGHKFVKGKGCDQCDHTGYKGRTTVYEYFIVDDEIRKRIEQGVNVYEIKDYLKNDKKMLSLWEKGLDLVISNVTTIEEVTSKVL